MVKNTLDTVAMFGGSFDPPHLGHKEIAKKAFSQLNIDLLLIVPAYQNPLKNDPLATTKQRVEMCHAIFDDLGNILVSNYEIKQEIRYTYESVKHFKELYNLKYLIIGADNLTSLHLWKEFEWLNSNIIWVIASRNSIEINDKNTLILRDFILLDIDIKVSSSEIRDGQKLEMTDSKISNQIEEIYNKGIK